MTLQQSGVDLAACEREPIHIPGSIQPHGVLLVLAPEALEILQASANAASVLQARAEDLLGRRLDDLLTGDATALLADLRGRAPARAPARLRTVTLDGRAFDAIVHRSGDAILLELEEAVASDAGSLDALYPQMRDFVDALQEAASVDALSELAARQVRSLTGFDRVLIYRFDQDWNGTVIAEDRNDVLPSYLDLRFPASDIPAQARDLYRLNRLRLIPDADYRPVPIVPAADPRTGAPVDLSFAVLRSVSPVHVEYMKNMGTAASMSISIVLNGQLWGLISCHDKAPRRVPMHVRTACDFLGQTVAMQLAAKAQSADVAYRVELQSVQSRLLAFMAAEGRFADGLAKHPDELLRVTGADGAAVVFDGTCSRIGSAPSEDDVRRIVAWLASRGGEDLFCTDSLAFAMPGAEAMKDTASGLLAVSISQLHPSYVLWFRPEVVQTVQWGGDPHKPAEPAPGEDRLHPRKSFEMWKEILRLKSRPWQMSEIETARELRNAIVGIVLRKAEELAGVTEQLARSNKELEAFSYSVSHDLRAPFRHIVGYAELLREDEAIVADARRRRFVDTIIESAFSAGKLVDDLLSFSQMGRASLMQVKVDMNALVAEVRRKLAAETGERRIEWRVDDLLPATGDPSMLRQVWQNLISNAIKYTRTRDPAVVEIASRRADGEIVYTVRDNGIGFDMAYVGKLFGVFQRLHRVEEFEGTGIGLANVKRIVERHGGRVWAEGALDRGATFGFSLPAAGSE